MAEGGEHGPSTVIHVTGLGGDVDERSLEAHFSRYLPRDAFEGIQIELDPDEHSAVLRFSSSQVVSSILSHDTHSIGESTVTVAPHTLDDIHVGAYTFEQPYIGYGTFGTVFKGRYNDTSRVVAGKQFKSMIGRNKELARREIEAINHLFPHENIVEIAEIASHGRDLWLVMEYVEGGDLAKYLTTRNPDLRARLLIIKNVINGVRHMHTRTPPCAHRDLKPNNILISTNGRHLTVKLCDFGLSRIREGSMTTPQVGTRLYQAPEVHQGERYDGKAADIFSLGLTMLDILQANPSIRCGTFVDGRQPLCNAMDSSLRQSGFSLRRMFGLRERCYELIHRVVNISDSDHSTVKALKILIQQMIAYAVEDRPDINQVSKSGYGTRVIMGGGERASFWSVNDLGTATTWVQMAILSESEVFSHASICELQSGFVVIGGYNGGKYSKRCLEFDTISGQWTEHTPMPTARSYSTSVRCGDMIYVMGGANGSSWLSTVECVNLQGEATWKTLRDMPFRFDYPKSCIVDSTILCFGSGGRREFAEYNITRDVWFELTVPDTVNTYCINILQQSGRVFVLGGDNICAEYNPDTRTWSTHAQPRHKHYFPAVSVSQDRIYVLGGYNSGGTIEEYDIHTKTWTTCALKMPNNDMGEITAIHTLTM